MGDRTDRTLQRTLIVLALVGIGIAGYLTWVHYEGLSPICAIDDGCEESVPGGVVRVHRLPGHPRGTGDVGHGGVRALVQHGDRGVQHRGRAAPGVGSAGAPRRVDL